MPRWSNWSRTVSASPAAVASPVDETEVVSLIRSTSGRVKAVGAGHSWSRIATTDGTLVRTDHLAGLRAVDRGAGTATFGAGTRLRDAVAALDAVGLALPILGSIDHQSLAGATATGTHGSSLAWGNLSTLLRRVRLVDGTGVVHDIGADDPRLDGARVHLGALGLLTEVTVDVGPAFRLREDRTTASWDEVLADLPRLAQSAEYVKLWWLPHTTPVIVFRYSRTDAPPTVGRIGRWLDEHVVNRWLFDGLLRLGGRLPALVPRTNRLVGATYFAPSTAVGPSARMFTLAEPPRHREAEQSVPLAYGAEALRRLRDLIAARDLAVDFIVEVRFVKGDHGWMSPAHGRDSVQIGAYMAHAPGIDGYFDGFAEAVAELDGRPHWGKELTASPDRVDRWYPRAASFRALARELDPDGRFRNPLLDSVLG